MDDSRIGEVPTTAWSFRPPGTTFYSSPVVDGERVYIVGSRQNRGTIYCVDASTGRRVWSCRPPGYRATFSTPVIAEGVLYVGEGVHHARDARLVAVAIQGVETGEVLWTFSVPGHIECAPLVDQGRIVFTAGDDGVYSLNLSAKRHQPPELHWHVGGDQIVDAETALALVGDTLCVGSGRGGNEIVLLDAETGQITGRTPCEAPVFSLPAVQGQDLVVGAGEGDYVRPNDSPFGVLFRLDLATQSVVWTRQLPATVLGAVTWRDDWLYCGCADGFVYRVAMDGQLSAKWDSGATLTGSLIVGDTHLVGHDRSGSLWCLDRNSMKLVWRHRLGYPGSYVSSPVLADGSIYIGTDNDGLLKIVTTD